MATKKTKPTNDKELVEDLRPKHAKHGPSTLRTKELCPGYTSSPESSAAADEGTLMHEAAETGDLSSLNAEQAAQVQQCLDYVAKLEKGATESYKEIVLEVCGEASSAGGEENVLTYGTADRVIVHLKKKHADVVDYKMGRWPVDEAEVNLQGWAYACGVFHQFPGVDEVTVHFLMPRLDIESKHTFHRGKDMPRMLLRIIAVIAKAEDPNKKLSPHPKACQYCANKATCPALTEQAVIVARKAHFDLPEDLDPGAITDPRQISRVLDIIPSIEGWAQSMRQMALDAVRNGMEIPGYSLKHRSGKRVIRDMLLAWDILNKKFKLELEDFLPACSVKITEIEAAVKAKAERGKGSETLRQLNSEFAQEGIITTTTDVEFLQKDK